MPEQTNFCMEGGIVTAVSPSGRRKTIASIDSDGVLRWMPGMIGAYARKFDEWKKRGKPAPGNFVDKCFSPVIIRKVASDNGINAAPIAPLEEKEEDFPPFSKIHGKATPGFMEWIESHGLNDDEIDTLIKKLERT